MKKKADESFFSYSYDFSLENEDDNAEMKDNTTDDYDEIEQDDEYIESELSFVQSIRNKEKACYKNHMYNYRMPCKQGIRLIGDTQKEVVIKGDLNVKFVTIVITYMMSAELHNLQH